MIGILAFAAGDVLGVLIIIKHFGHEGDLARHGTTWQALMNDASWFIVDTDI